MVKPVVKVLEDRIAQANGRLRAGNVGVSILQRNSRLYVRAVLPPKPGVIRDPHRQEISLGVRANPAGLKFAEAEAPKISGLVACKEFCWDPYLQAYLKDHEEAQIIKVGDWIKQFEEYYFATRKPSESRDQTWNKDYLRVLRELPADRELNGDLIKELIVSTEAGTRLRKRFCIALGALSRFAKIDFEVKPYLGNDGIRKILPRDLPDEETILAWFHRLRERNPEWGWVYGVLACYGVRPAEIWQLDYESLSRSPGILTVLDGKTGGREGILPFYPEWWEEWQLGEIRCPHNSAKDVGRAVSQYFRRAGVPFKPYDLRHAWAGRAAKFGIDSGSAAYQMGHSVRVHHDYYGYWYNERHQRQVFHMLMQRLDRPQAPNSHSRAA